MRLISSVCIGWDGIKMGILCDFCGEGPGS
jgi:hypothetical protein